jgi:uncharacterized protein (DUF1778 family)
MAQRRHVHAGRTSSVSTTGQSKVDRISLRIRPADNRLIREGARIRSEHLFSERTHFVLSDKDWRAFMRELDRSPRRVASMVDLLSGHYHRQRREPN